MPGGQRFFVEFETDEACPFGFLDDSTIVLFFASWAFSQQYGGQHELAQAAGHLKNKRAVDLRPLLRYADRNVESRADQLELERSWQPAAELAACARAVAAAWETPDGTLQPLVAGYEHLAPRLRELAAMCDWADARSLRVRMTFDLADHELHAQRPAGHERGASPLA
jgi:hypothetical protein